MPTRKPARAPKTVKTEPTPVAPTRGIPWKPILIVLGALIFVGALLHSTGVLQDLTAGPREPLPRTNLGLVFGTPLKDFLARFPGAKDRSFNNDPQFRIVTLKDRPDMPEGATEAEVIFHQGKLYFVSAKWDHEAAEKIPVERMAEQFRRWKKKQPNPGIALQGAARDTTLNEWYFDDGTTEMILRDLRFNGISNRWMDLRDASNDAAQRAFAPYRFDLQ